MKDIRRARGSKAGAALLEGPHLVCAALAAGLELQCLLATEDFIASPAGAELAAALPRPALLIHPPLLRELTDSGTPRGVVAVVHLPRPALDLLPAAPGLYVYAEGLQDPGNLGALARSCEAAGAQGLVLGPGCVTLTHPRALRGSAGSLLRLPLARATAGELEHHLSAHQPQWAALATRGGEDLYATELPPTLLLALGAEGAGLPEDLERRAESKLTIPIATPVESLNATVAAAVVMFEWRRRQLAGPSD